MTTLSPILTTKLFAPSLPPRFLPRPQLLTRLNAASLPPLVLVSGPAGAGKTMAVREWVAADARPTAWLNLDARDNDLERFVGYVVHALQTVAPEVGEGLLLTLQAQPRPAVEVLATRLLNDLTALGAPLRLVLDDYHQIETDEIHGFVQHLLDYPPPGFQLVIITREDPPLALSRLRARQRMIEIRARDLRLSADEVSALLAGVLGVPPPLELAVALTERTEGWVAGVQMAGLSLQNEAEPLEFLAQFTGSHRYITDYLMDEVLRHQPPALRQFLLESAVLGQLSASLCDAALQRSDSAVLLAEIERNNVFLIALDDRREWYRYHHLLADLLRLQRTPELISREADVLRRASQWCAAAGLAEDAIDYAFQAGDQTLAADGLVRFGVELLERHEYNLVFRWLLQLTDDTLAQRMDIRNLYLAGFFLIYWRQSKVADPVWQQFAARIEACDPFVALVHQLTHESVWKSPLAAQQRAEQALIELGDRQPLRRLILMQMLMSFNVVRGDLDAALELADASAVEGRHQPVPLLARYTQMTAGMMRMHKGDHQQARAIYERVIAQQEDTTGMAYLELGAIALNQARLSDARPLLEKARHIAERSDAHSTLLVILRVLVFLEVAEGRIAAARDWADQAAHIAKSSKQVVEYVRRLQHDTHEPFFWLILGERARAEQWLADYRPHLLSNPDANAVLYEREQLVLARLLLAWGDVAEGLAAAQAAVDTMRARGALAGAPLAVLAMARHANGLPTARDALREFLALVLHQRAVFTHVLEGPLLRDLLTQAVADPNFAPYHAHIAVMLDWMQRAPWQPAVATALSPGAALAEPFAQPLSERERQILRLLASGQSNQELADTLVLSLSTVKWYTHQIYSKLGVRNRRAAVARAGELGML